jgi:hypothetical protein
MFNSRSNHLQIKYHLHWRHLLAKPLATVTRDSQHQYLPWPPWAMQHRLDHFYLCHPTQSGQGKKGRCDIAHDIAGIIALNFDNVNITLGIIRVDHVQTFLTFEG